MSDEPQHSELSIQHCCRGGAKLVQAAVKEVAGADDKDQTLRFECVSPVSTPYDV
jgi:hypothetical protein